MSKTTKDRLCEYIRQVERDTGKLVTAAKIEGRSILLEFNKGSSESVNPADLVDMKS
ncbi:hypothetical protein [Roseovarius pacificus]|uniref:hypothetical protein n=1 Tax=Roseovarius pacificus TaxID=337701 RepID=UPI0025937C9A|nr:hypothetical protein [Roseovarius pacificus]